MNLADTLAENLAAALVVRPMGQRLLAERAGVALSTVNDMAKGSFAANGSNLSSVEKIAGALGLTTSEILASEEDVKTWMLLLGEKVLPVSSPPFSGRQAASGVVSWLKGKGIRSERALMRGAIAGVKLGRQDCVYQMALRLESRMRPADHLHLMHAA